MDSITQAEYYKRFDDYMRDKVCNETVELKKQQWYVAHLFEFDRVMKNEGLTVRPGYHINEVGERVDE